MSFECDKSIQNNIDFKVTRDECLDEYLPSTILYALSQNGFGKKTGDGIETGLDYLTNENAEKIYKWIKNNLCEKNK